MEGSSSVDSSPAEIIELRGKSLFKADDRISYYFANFATKDAILVLYITPTLANKFSENKFLLLRNVHKINESTYKVHQKTKIFSIADFALCESKIEEFLNPPVLSVPAAALSPMKRRITVEGFVNEVDELITCKGKRRFFMISENNPNDDGPSMEKIKVKLWGEKAEMKVPEVGTRVQITNVNVGIYNSIRDLNSTPLTSIKETDEEVNFSVLVSAISWGEKSEDSIIMTDRDSYLYISTTNLIKVVEIESNTLCGKQISGRRKGHTITTLDPVQ